MYYSILIISHFTGFWKQNCVKCPKTGVKNKKSGSGTGKGTLSLFVVLGQRLCYTDIAALLRSPCRGKEVESQMDNLIAFFQTVVAEVVAYYLCKWLDSLMCKGSKH